MSVYVLQPGTLPFFKIGFSENVAKRVNELQTGCPLKIEVRYEGDGSRARERELHVLMRKWNTYGEWHAATVESLALLHKTLGVQLEIKTVDETLFVIRIERHREELEAIIESARSKAAKINAAIDEHVERAERTLMMIADQDALKEMHEQLRRKRAGASEISITDPDEFQAFVARLFPRDRAGDAARLVKNIRKAAKR